jgi:hypothetical protein
MSRLFPRHLLLALLGTAALAGCSTDQLDVVVLSARAPGDKCDFSDDTKYVSGGLVDFAPYVTPSGAVGVTTTFGQVFSWENNMLAVPLIVNGQTVDPSSGNDFIAEQAQLSYQYSDPAVALPAEVENLHAIIAAGCTRDKCSVGLDLIGAGAATILDGSLTATPQTLLVTFVLTGKTTAGRSTHTNPVSFPLTVLRSSTTPLTCPAGTKLNTGVCGVAGRDTTVDCISST